MEAQVSLTVAFRSSALLGLVSLIFLLTIPHRFSMGFRSGKFAGQSSTVTPFISFIYIAQINTTGVDHCALQSIKRKYKKK